MERSYRENKRSRSRSPRRPLMGRDLNSDKMVYISNIPYDVRWMELKDLVREKAGDVAYVEMIENVDGKSKGCAVVEFRDREAAKKCVETMHRMMLKDRSIVVKEIREPERFFKKVKDETGVDFFANRSFTAPHSYPAVEEDGPPMSDGFETYGLSPLFLSRLGIQPPLTNRVFVSNVPFSAGTTKIRDVFSIAGKVTFVELPLDKTGKSKGVAVVEYSHPVEAVQAVSMLNSQKYFDKALNVRMDAIPPKQPSEMRPPGELPHGLKGVGLGLGANGMPLSDVSQIVGIQASNTTAPPPKIFNSTFVASGNDFNTMPLGGPRQNSPFVNSSMVQQMTPTPQKAPNPAFQQGSNAFAPGSINPYGNSGPGGQGVGIDLGSGMGYTRGFHGLQGGVGSAGIPTGTTSIGPMNSPFPNCMPGSMNGAGSSSGSGNYRNLPSLLSGPPFDPVPGIHSQSSTPRFIVIRNLPLDYTWQTLRDRLRSFGDIEFAGIVQPGVGKIRFRNARDAERAAGTLNGMHVEGRPIVVDLAIND
uniref:RRM domain-containing protein n=1 Tax=Trichuris muris TaxID=70415 RepID=A0A5S6Q9W3_TRIMR